MAEFRRTARGGEVKENYSVEGAPDFSPPQAVMKLSAFRITLCFTWFDSGAYLRVTGEGHRRLKDGGLGDTHFFSFVDGEVIPEWIQEFVEERAPEGWKKIRAMEVDVDSICNSHLIAADLIDPKKK